MRKCTRPSPLYRTKQRRKAGRGTGNEASCYPGWRLPLPSPCLSFANELCHSVETVLSEAYGTCVQWLPHVGRMGTLFPVVKTWMASIHPLYALDLALGLLCDIPHNRIIAFIHIYGCIPMSKNSISSGRIWILPFAESIRELHALFPLGSMCPWSYIVYAFGIMKVHM